MRFSLCTVSLLATLSFAPVVTAAPPGDRLLDQVSKAYQGTQQYQAVTHFEMTQMRGRWRSTQSADMPIALDRAEGKLVVDKPDLLVVVDDKLRLKSDQLPGRHLEVDAPQPLTYESLLQEIPFLAQPALPDLAFLLAGNPVQVLSEGASTSATPLDADPADERSRPRLRFDAGDAVYTLSVNPESHLIEEVLVDIDVAQLGGEAGDTMRLTYRYDIQKHNEPIDAAAFAFDASGSTAADSLQALMGGGPGQGGGGGGAGHPLQDQAAPAIELALADGGVFKLDEVTQDVVVLDFWATWCPPCREGLPKIQEIADWAKDQDKSVGVFAVNVGETADEAQAFWKQQGLTMPIVMDSEGTVAGAYGVTGIPQTVVIHDGKVKHIHVGFSPDLADVLKAQIEPLLHE